MVSVSKRVDLTPPYLQNLYIFIEFFYTGTIY